MLGTTIITIGVLTILFGGSEVTGLIGFGLVILGGYVFWQRSATKAYLDAHKDD